MESALSSHPSIPTPYHQTMREIFKRKANKLKEILFCPEEDEKRKKKILSLLPSMLFNYQPLFSQKLPFVYVVMCKHARMDGKRNDDDSQYKQFKQSYCTLLKVKRIGCGEKVYKNNFFFSVKNKRSAQVIYMNKVKSFLLAMHQVKMKRLKVFFLQANVYLTKFSLHLADFLCITQTSQLAYKTDKQSYRIALQTRSPLNTRPCQVKRERKTWWCVSLRRVKTDLKRKKIKLRRCVT